MLHLIDVSKNFGKRTLFRHASLHIAPGDRLGLVGPNGSGKTTLFRLLLGQSEPEEGEMRRRKLLHMGYLSQEIETQREGRVLRTVVDGVRDFGTLRRERKALLVELEACAGDELRSAKLAGRLAEIDERFEQVGGYALEGEARAVLTGLGFTEDDFERPLRTFSGGWQVRAELARLLLEKPDLLLLDEPTNHLDLESMMWFENYLAGFGGAFVLVAHDREFLNRVVSKIVEVRTDGLKLYPGDYDSFCRQKADEEVLQEKHYKEQQTKIRELQDFVDRNRVRKDKARQVQSRIKVLQSIEKIEAPHKEGSIHFEFPKPPRCGDIVMRLEDVTQRYGDNTVFEDLQLTLRRGDRIAVVGKNGAGKSTLLKLVADRLKPTAGKRVLGANVTLDHFAQHQIEELDPTETPLRTMQRIASLSAGPAVRGILGAFRFQGDDVDKTVAVLSGGEKARLALAKMLLRPASLLLLDEPTNHLDIASREVLEQALASYDGTLCITSHDRRFMDAVATKVLEVEDGVLSWYPGTYSDYQWKKAQLAADAERRRGPAAAQQTEPRTKRGDERQRKRREAEKRAVVGKALRPLQQESDKLETTIEKAEARLAGLADRLADPALYQNGEKARRAVADHDKLEKRVASLFARWEKLQAQIERRKAAVDGGDAPR